MTIAYACILIMGLLPNVATGIAKKGFEGYDNSMPRQWLAKQDGFRARANAAQANLFESLPLFFAAVIIAQIAHAPQFRIDVLAIGFVIARIAYLETLNRISVAKSQDIPAAPCTGDKRIAEDRKTKTSVITGSP